MMPDFSLGAPFIIGGLVAAVLVLLVIGMLLRGLFSGIGKR